ncbi:MAG: hypothetical protein CFE23_05330 [Flavobacterium sp. BFFFF1]|uniref:hypothetical protein n=1 Tax=unclassified Flavobacterium TaxID=196869 RepID=UPI000BC98EA5|nr:MULTISPECIES: hypothetical protein [unclassified Flavobacterium]OYU81190.1 MAG: hypothetical protein CFE23_05330 [Flavobacterium sp. BFFFF1]
MQPIKDDHSLGLAIQALEFQRQTELTALKQHFDYTLDSLNPKNIIREKIQDIAGGSTLKSNLIKYGIGILGGFVVKKAVVGGSHNFFKKMLGTAAQAAFSGLILKAPLSEKRNLLK